MASLKPITIIGGGLAGLTLGIGLRRQGIPATIYEAGSYPRHRVCGEFISGRGLRVLNELGIRQRLVDAGATYARTAAFFLGARSSPVRPLPAPALCLSRFKLDATLANCFRAAGGDLLEHHRFRGEVSADGIVLASGRRLERPIVQPRWLGLKVHAREVALTADLEMHGSSNGYVGFCRLSPDEVNVCSLFCGSPPQSGPLASWKNALEGAPGTPLRERMSDAVLDQSSFCSVAGFSLRPQRAVHGECSIGDALTMIPPVTGNGMSMAFEAAGLAIGPLASFSRGDIRWARACEVVARECDLTFAARLKAARCLHWMMFSPLLRTSLGSYALGSDWVWRTLFARTR